MTTNLRLLLTTLTLGLAVGAEPYFAGLLPGRAELPAARERAALIAGGARLIELELRADLFARPGGAAAADTAVAELLEAGCQPLLVLRWDLEGRAPAGLFEPVFTAGGDFASYGAQPSPANPWGVFVARVIERFDGDGTADAPGSPKVAWYRLATVPFEDGAFAWPGGAEAVARMVTVARAAGDSADWQAHVGYDPGGLAALEALLGQERVPVSGQLDFVVCHAGVAATADAACYGPDGLLAAVDAAKAPFRRRSGYPPRLICGGVGVAAGPHQRAGAAAIQIVAAAAGLVSTQMAAAFEPYPGDAGLIEDVRALPTDGSGWRRREACYALVTFDRLLGEALSRGDLRFADPVPTGNDTRAYRFAGGGREVYVAWAHDSDGPECRATVRLPLEAGRAWYRCGWDFCRTGRPDESVSPEADGLRVELGTDPVYFVSDDPPLAAPLTEPPPAPRALSRYAASEDSGGAALSCDGRLESGWSSSGDARRWWRLECLEAPATADRVRLYCSRGAARSVLAQVSADGELWRDTARAPLPEGGGWTDIGLGATVSSRWWRLVFEMPAGQELRLAEVELARR